MSILRSLLQKLLPRQRVVGRSSGVRGVAILLDSVNSELSERILGEFSAADKELVRAELPKAGLASMGSRTFVIAKYLDVQISNRMVGKDYLCKDLIAALEGLFRTDISGSARKLARTLHTESRVSIGEALQSIRVGGGWAENAVIILDSLESEVASDMLQRMAPESIAALQKTRRDLPFIRDARRRQELCRFLELGQETHELDFLLQTLGVLAAANPQRCAEQIEYFGRAREV